MIEEILNDVSFSDEEFSFFQKALKEREVTSLLTEEEYEDINNKYKALLPYSNIKDYNFSFGESATSLIKQIFDKYVDDKTLVLTTTSEHPKVVNLLKKCKNVQYVIDKFMLQDFKIPDGIERVFVYVIGTTCGLGNIIYNNEIKTIVDKAKAKCKDVVTVLDAVQEIFLVPRDYSMYDYIIGTGHVFLPEYNLGFLLSKDNTIGKKLKISKTFYTMLTNVLKRKDFLNLFHTIMEMEFSFSRYSDLKIHSGVNHLFLISTPNNEFDSIGEDDTIKTQEGCGVLLRGCWAVSNKEEFLQFYHTIQYLIANGG